MEPRTPRPCTDGPFLVADPPRPVRGCATCAELNGLRASAQAEFDRSAEVDANVRLRRHQREEHAV
ncbi:hypothetical protein ACQEWB_22840 [Streptomyces sp. CA-249302]|uniref:hypothetical protein n=1 Tax=Streptomyces sp. CA-249302 TaxID=3240058 RepID=UPI003D8E32F5